ncbi:MAG: DUF4159 domain-containing protein [Verrucomicrobia bacterium]|nr:DUF4159 domain-containing protein [Verrucomicrobiota bacterium]
MRHAWPTSAAFVLTITLAASLVAVLGQFVTTERRSPAPAPDDRSSSKLIRNRGPESRAGVPEWQVNDQFRADVFTFVRLRYRSRGWGGWRVDYPGADLNFSYRLEQLTSMRVNPDGLILDIDDPRLFQYPFAFIIDPRSLVFSDDEAAALRRYLMNGGFLLVDDFWGNRMWDHLMREMKKVFPNREPVSLPLDHPIFNIPFPMKEKPQVPSEDSAHATQNLPGLRRTWEFEITWEEPKPADYRAFLDDKGRIMMLICWNTDLSDGWEEEGISEWFFSNFSEKYSYPMGINIVIYALTH